MKLPPFTQEMIDAAVKRIRPELTAIPPCRDCGAVPKQYTTFNDGTVQCAADERRACYQRVER